MQVLEIVKTFKYILGHLMLLLLREPKLALFETCFSNDQSSYIFLERFLIINQICYINDNTG